MKRREPGDGNNCATKVETTLIQCKKMKMSLSETSLMCRWVYRLPLDVVYNIMRSLDLNRLHALCRIIFDIYGIVLVAPTQFDSKIKTFSTTQIEILRRTSEVLNEVNLQRSGTWLRPMVAEIDNKLSYLRYGDTYNCIEITVDKMLRDLNSVQELIKIMKEAHIMNFCYTNICCHCDVRSGEKTYFSGTPECIDLCVLCYRNMQDTMITDTIDNKILASGKAWVTQKAIKNALLFKGRFVKKWLTENNVRVYRNGSKFHAMRPPKIEFYLLSDVLKVVNKSRKDVVYLLF